MSRSIHGSSKQSNRGRRCAALVGALALARAGAATPAASGVQPVRPFAFEANRGQVASEVQFVARTGEATAFIAGHGCTLALAGSGDGGAVALGLSFVGGGDARVEGERLLPGRVNVFRGSDPSGWRTGIPTYSVVRAHDVVPGVDATYYGDGAHLEYDLVVAPGVDPASLRLRFDGADALAMTPGGDLDVRVCGRTIVQHAPFIYQETAYGRREIAGSFVVLGEREVGFEVCGQDPSEPLVIDPVVGYSTLVGGSSWENEGYGTVDPITGEVYLLGSTDSADYPVQGGVPPNTYGGGSDIVVTKVAADGSSLVYATYIGGAQVEFGSDIRVDASGNAFVVGTTRSGDFPTTASAYQQTAPVNKWHAYFLKLSSGGDQLLYSTYFGGTNADYSYGQAAVDAQGHVFVSGETSSTDFPTTTGAYQRILRGATNDYVAEFDPALSGSASLLYSTYLGLGTEGATSLALDSAGRACIAGSTSSSSFPTTSGAYDRSFNGGSDAFFSRINPGGNGAADLVYSTFLGGSGADASSSIALNAQGEAIVGGTTASTNFPVTPATAFQKNMKGTGDFFVTRISSSGSSLLYSTYLGGTGTTESNLHLATDPVNGHVVLTGITSSTDFPHTADALDASYGGGTYDAFVAKLDTSAAKAASLKYASYLGGSDAEVACGISVGPAGSVFVTGYTRSTDFPVTPGAFQTILNGTADNFVFRQNP